MSELPESAWCLSVIKLMAKRKGNRVNGYVKLFQSILGSSIWAGTDADLRVWIAMLVLKDRHHVVRLSLPGLANIARVSLQDCAAAIIKFQQPDKYSTSTEFEGRKIQELGQGGWLVLNGQKYADMLSYDQRLEYQRVKQAEYRARRKLRGLTLTADSKKIVERMLTGGDMTKGIQAGGGRGRKGKAAANGGGAGATAGERAYDQAVRKDGQQAADEKFFPDGDVKEPPLEGLPQPPESGPESAPVPDEELPPGFA